MPKYLKTMTHGYTVIVTRHDEVVVHARFSDARGATRFLNRWFEVDEADMLTVQQVLALAASEMQFSIGPNESAAVLYFVLD